MRSKQKTELNTADEMSSGSNGTSARNRRAYSPSFAVSDSGRNISWRAVACFLLCFVFPPAGILVMWRAGVFRVRGRVILSVVSFGVMILLFYWIIPESQPMTYMPVPAKAVEITNATDYDYVDPYDVNVLNTVEPTVLPGDLNADGTTVEPLATADEAALPNAG